MEEEEILVRRVVDELIAPEALIELLAILLVLVVGAAFPPRLRFTHRMPLQLEPGG